MDEYLKFALLMRTDSKEPETSPPGSEYIHVFSIIGSHYHIGNIQIN